MAFPSVVTLWFVNTADPGDVLGAEPKADRGFGRKLLAQINPAWPITPIGEFPLNRSSTPGRAEYYIAGFPGVAVLQTFVEDVEQVSETTPHLREALEAADVFLVAEGTDSDYAGFAHFAGAQLRRAFAATREAVIEDAGLPDPFEAPYWAGETAEQLGGISLPFVPKELARAAQSAWLGVDISPDGPDLDVVGFAVDGRPEPKIAPAPKRTKTVSEVASRLAEKDSGYDDYVTSDDQEEGGEFAELAEASLAAAKRVGRIVSRRTKDLVSLVKERIRHSDRW